MAALLLSPQAVNVFSDPLFHQPEIVPVVNLFEHGYWRLDALTRIGGFFLLRSNIYYYLWLLIQVGIWLGTRAVRLLGFRNFNPGGTPSLRRTTFRITIAVLRKWPNDFITGIWWHWYQFLADEGDFEMDYVAAWRYKLEQSNNSGPAPHDVHLYVENSHLKAPIPTGPDDAATFRALQMWYCLIQFRMGLGEILLPKRLTRIDRVQVGVPDCLETVATDAPGRYVKSSFDRSDLVAESNHWFLEDRRVPTWPFSRTPKRSRAR